MEVTILRTMVKIDHDRRMGLPKDVLKSSR